MVTGQRVRHAIVKSISRQHLSYNSLSRSASGGRAHTNFVNVVSRGRGAAERSPRSRVSPPLKRIPSKLRRSVLTHFQRRSTVTTVARAIISPRARFGKPKKKEIPRIALGTWTSRQSSSEATQSVTFSTKKLCVCVCVEISVFFCY